MPTLRVPSRVSAPSVRRRATLPLAAALLLAGVLLLALAPPASGQPGGALVDVVEAGGIVDGQVAGHVEDTLARAARDGAEVVVLQLDVRGAIGGAAERIAGAVRDSEVPVVTWVGPPGARATGGGLLIAQSGHLRAAAHGTLHGPAVPVDLTAQDAAGGAGDAYTQAAGGPLLDHALAGGAVAVAPSGGDQTLPPDAALPPGVAFADVTVAAEAAAAEAGFVDLTAPVLSDLLLALGGREVVTPAGASILDIDPVTTVPRFNNLGLVRQVLHAVAHPTLAYLLLVAGALALLFEVFQPGFGVAGIAGASMAALGGYGLVVLPARPLAVAAVVAGLLLLAADLALGRLGVLTAAGTAAFAAGSWWLLPGPDPLAVPIWVVVVVTISVVVFFVGVMTTVLRAQGNQAASGAERVVGETGVVRSMLNPEGHVFVGGALWRARAPDDAGRVRTGTRVHVVGLDDNLTLEVVPLDDDDAAAAGPSPSSSVVR